MRSNFEFLSFPIFSWDGWDSGDEGTLTFYDVHFLLPSLEQYNGKTVDFENTGKLSIYDNDEDATLLWSDYVVAVPEFMEVLKIRYPGI